MSASSQAARIESPDAIEPPIFSKLDVFDPALYLNREISQLLFNVRVLDQALDERLPLLERLTFLLIFSANVDEFFEIRVAGLKRRLARGKLQAGVDGLDPIEVLARVGELAHAQIERQYRILNQRLLPALEAEGIRFLRRRQWSPAQIDWIGEYFEREIMPVVSPIGLDPAHPFPRLANKSLTFIVSLEGIDAFGREGGLAILPAPRSLPRLVKLPEGIAEREDYVFLSSIIHANVESLFPGMHVTGCHQFRLTRNADLAVGLQGISDLASALEGELLAQPYGDGVRLEVSDSCPQPLCDLLLKQFSLEPQDLYRVAGPVNLARLFGVLEMTQRPELRYPSFVPVWPERLWRSRSRLFEVIQQRDVLLHHPFDAFEPIELWLHQAANDPGVLAIKQTLYRTRADSMLVGALVEAAHNGKEVTVVIELRARFDEANNLHLAERLQRAGVNVIYGVMAYKTHAKLLHIVRREPEGLRHYAHLGTGNYHNKTAMRYTDYSLLTARQPLCQDVLMLFRQLSGMERRIDTQVLLHAPFTLHSSLLDKIRGEAEHALAGRPSGIIIKCNALTEPQLVAALYRASQAGVRCRLIVRGICVLRPGVPGVSENIEVRSVIGRFLEHTRVYRFENGGKAQTWCASADLMERNLLHRVESCFPILDQGLAERIFQDLMRYLDDTHQSWHLDQHGSYHPPTGGETPAVQQALLHAPDEFDSHLH
ncbi:polyphosphate kinase 1 [Halotalea alkalilenta]|uniref:polyphosphate kinase 1 n=1 Tax=Halotalea alkalilenta TaxID=376489 RepID=UPI000B17DE46